MDEKWRRRLVGNARRSTVGPLATRRNLWELRISLAVVTLLVVLSFSLDVPVPPKYLGAPVFVVVFRLALLNLRELRTLFGLRRWEPVTTPQPTRQAPSTNPATPPTDETRT